jgi:hypothetical protein
LLDSSNVNNFDTIEKIVYYISTFHLKNKNLELDMNKYNIEFCFDNENSNFKIDYNKKKSYSLFSIITFLEDDSNPFILTNIDLESYKYKEIPDENTFVCFKPKKNSQIVFDSSKYYGFYKLKENNCKILKINIWEKLDNGDFEISRYLSNVNNKKHDLNDITITISLSENEISKETVIYKQLINIFLYEKNSRIEYFENIIKKYPENSKIIINNIIKDYIDIAFLQDNYPDIADDLYPFVNKKTEISVDINNRFCKNKLIRNILSKDVCYWILNECEKNKFEQSKYNNYPTYLNIETIPSVLNFLLYVSNFWSIEIKKLYRCENIKLNISDIFVSKYTKSSHSEIKNADGSFLSLNIYLNSDVDYIDGEIVFEDNEQKLMIKHGDVLIYNGKKKRTSGVISDGVKYILVIMLEIIL